MLGEKKNGSRTQRKLAGYGTQQLPGCELMLMLTQAQGSPFGQKGHLGLLI